MDITTASQEIINKVPNADATEFELLRRKMDFLVRNVPSTEPSIEINCCKDEV